MFGSLVACKRRTGAVGGGFAERERQKSKVLAWKQDEKDLRFSIVHEHVLKVCKQRSVRATGYPLALSIIRSGIPRKKVKTLFERLRFVSPRKKKTERAEEKMERRKLGRTERRSERALLWGVGGMGETKRDAERRGERTRDKEREIVKIVRVHW
jgi:hypothetical protein